MLEPARLSELLGRFYNGSEETVDVEYMGRFLVNGRMVLRVPEEGLEEQWAASLVPIEYLPLYGLKLSEPEQAGGLFEAAPFDRYDPMSLQNQWLNLPPEPEPEPLFEIGTDDCGAQFWLGESGVVYGHNLDNQFQPLGALKDFVDFAIDTALRDVNWSQELHRPTALAPFRLTAINTMD
ncbi:hypothetical protein [Lignipirellula cremea]|uniref:Uncharacterized protein n=1 Tax=Lignipirellula cremea TaxID=2528010 RepID=A0A518DLE6_9BACT|nr:hypothetical protein [Lignipirellula cremea]QDU92659.1 hypothetical protein Pla8534_04070 [Lignipirellula cremea]